ncbi:MAG: hypothetical protein PHI50_04660 [Alphaproteobacteria bacterium]|nr:hypothetical protein [Alphaproteobacteria bacterium]
MKKILLSVLICSSFLGGCATGLNSFQKDEYMNYEVNDVLVEEKNTTTAAVLGILPGGGSFYTRNYGIGVINLLFWPLSILWDPISGINGAESLNYHVTKSYLKREKNKEMNALESKFIADEISKKEYVLEKRKIDNKYQY